MAKQLNQSGGGANFSTPTGTIAATGGVIANPTPDPGMDNITAHSSNSRIRSISNTTSIYPTGGNNTPQTQKVGLAAGDLMIRRLCNYGCFASI